MGGAEGARGYLYQGIASIIRALSDPNWDTIFVEYLSANDKIDIALKKGDVLIRSIQVKSTIDSFSEGKLIGWMSALIADKPADNYELILIGNCTNGAQKMLKSIKKYYKNNIDDEVQKSLSKLPAGLLDNNISIDILPYNISNLEKIIISELHEYLSNHILLKHDQLSFVVSSLISDHMILSTTQKGRARVDFDKTLQERIKLVIRNYSPKRTPITIISFKRGVSTNNNDSIVLNLIDMFNERQLKPDFNWNKDIVNRVESFFSNSISISEAYELHLDTHYAISFLSGRLLDNKSGINIVPVQKSPQKILWEYDPLDITKYPKLNIEHQEVNVGFLDTALILNISRDIYHDVMNYIANTDLKIGRAINCTVSHGGPTNFSIVNGTHCVQLANSICSALCQRTISERRATLHIFSSVPNAFMFYLGQVSRPFGNTIIYDFDFDALNTCTYFPTICFFKEDK